MHIFAYIPAIIMLLLVMMPMGIAGLASTELAVTNKRIIGRLRKQTLSVPFEEVESVRVRRGLLGMIFDFGSVTIIGNGIRMRFPGVTKPGDMKAIIDTAVENALFGDAAKLPESETPPARKITAQAKPAAPKAAPPAPKEEPAPQGPEAASAAPLPPVYKDPNSW